MTSATFERWFWRAPLAAIVGLIAVWSLDRAPPVTQLANEPEGPARAGDYVTVFSHVERHRLCKTRLGRVFYDARDERTILPPLEFTPETLGRDDYRQRVPMPADAASGRGRLVLSLEWHCNPLHMLFPLTQTITVPVAIAP